MRRQTWRKIASFDDSASMRNSDTAKVSATSCSPIVFRYQAPVPSRVSKISSDIVGERVVPPFEPQCHVAMQDLVVPALIDDLGRLEQFGVLALDILDQLAAHQHRAMLAGHQGREPPAGDGAVDLDLLVRGQAIPELRPVDIDEIVGDQPAIAVERLRPVDIGRGVPLVELGLLVEVPHDRACSPS